MKSILVDHAPSEMAKAFLLYPLSAGHEEPVPEFVIERKERTMFGYQFVAILDGSGYLELNKRTWKLEAGQVMLLDLAKNHKYYADPDRPWEIVWFMFDGVQATSFFDFLDGAQNPVYSVSVDRFDKNAGYMEEMIRLLTYRPASLEIRSSSLINLILTEMMLDKMEGGDRRGERSGSAVSEDIYQALRYIEERYPEPLHLHDIADAISMSPFHFARLFKKNTGFTVMEYLLKFRLTQAKRLLKETHLPISEVAVKTGFQDQSYFSKIFKRYELISPKRYRVTASAPR